MLTLCRWGWFSLDKDLCRFDSSRKYKEARYSVGDKRIKKKTTKTETKCLVANSLNVYKCVLQVVYYNTIYQTLNSRRIPKRLHLNV